MRLASRSPRTTRRCLPLRLAARSWGRYRPTADTSRLLLGLIVGATTSDRHCNRHSVLAREIPVPTLTGRRALHVVVPGTRCSVTCALCWALRCDEWGIEPPGARP